MFPESWANQSGGVIMTQTDIEIATLCSFHAPYRCPTALATLLLAGPQSLMEDAPCDGSLKVPGCFGYMSKPFLAVFVLTIALPGLVLVLAAFCSRNIEGKQILMHLRSSRFPWKEALKNAPVVNDGLIFFGTVKDPCCSAIPAALLMSVSILA